MESNFEKWLQEVRAELQSINMPLDEWQRRWPFDFAAEHDAGLAAGTAAEKANRFWWREQNKALDRDCRKTPDCWLPRNHQGECQPVA